MCNIFRSIIEVLVGVKNRWETYVIFTNFKRNMYNLLYKLLYDRIQTKFVRCMISRLEL